jgi:hypothetical protein
LVQKLLSKLFPHIIDDVAIRPSFHAVKYGPDIMRGMYAHRRSLSRFPTFFGTHH